MLFRSIGDDKVTERNALLKWKKSIDAKYAVFNKTYSNLPPNDPLIKEAAQAKAKLDAEQKNFNAALRTFMQKFAPYDKPPPEPVKTN